MFIARLRERPTPIDVNTIKENIFVSIKGMRLLQAGYQYGSQSFLQVNVMQPSALVSESNQNIVSTVIEYSWASRKSAQAKDECLSNAILESLPCGILVVDAHNIVVIANSAARKMLAFEYAVEVGKKLFLPGERELRCNERYLQVSRRHIDYDGRAHNLIVLSDITASKLELAQLKHQSLSDDLTGLYNRRGLLNVSRHYVDAARRDRRKLLLIFADLDGLKKINDTLGHSAGDQAIKDVAEVLKVSMRTSDVTARIGGDEFVVLTTVAQGEQADNVVARLQDNMEAFNQNNRRPYSLAVSFGTAELDPESDIDLVDLLNRADCRMYEQKRRQWLAS